MAQCERLVLGLYNLAKTIRVKVVMCEHVKNISTATPKPLKARTLKLGSKKYCVLGSGNENYCGGDLKAGTAHPGKVFAGTWEMRDKRSTKSFGAHVFKYCFIYEHQSAFII